MGEKIKNTSCILPWVELQITPSGQVKTCCEQTESYSDDPRADLLTQFQTSPKAVKTRRLLMEGGEPSPCQRCLKNSSETKTYKTVKDKIWRSRLEVVAERSDDFGGTTSPVRFLDLRFSNLCNFACRMCDSYNSSQWKRFDRVVDRTSMPLQRWDQDPKVMDGILRLLPEVEEIYFAGGEPLLIDGHYRILQWLIDHGRTDVLLSYNTNLSVRSFRGTEVIDYWKHFPAVHLLPSLDSIGKEGEYIRVGMNWREMQSNLYYFLPFISGVNSVVSVYNVFSILDQILWLKTHFNIDNFLTCLQAPEYLSVGVLPYEIRKEASREYREFASKHASLLSDNCKRELNQISEYLLTKDQSSYAQQFKRFNSILDSCHDSDFSSVFPRMADWYEGLSGVID